MRDPGPSITPRSPLIWGAPLAGLLAGAALWLILGGPGAPARELDALTGRGSPAAGPTAATDPAGAALSTLASRPLFAEGGSPLPRITLTGVSRLPGRAAALVALGGAEPGWIKVGETVEGLTLVSVRSDSALFDSVNGPLTIPLGETVDGAAAAALPAGAPQAEGPPPGVKLPPEPNSAPRP